MLKITLTKTELEALPPDFQKEYKLNGDVATLDTDRPFEDVTKLKSALEHEKANRKTATERVTTLESELSVAVSEREKLEARAKPAGDLEKSWQTKLDKAVADAKAKEDSLKKQLTEVLVDNKALELATEISVSPELMLPHIKSRLTIEEQDGKMITRVLDEDGKASADSLTDLREKLLANEKFAPILTASKASGGGASAGKNVPAGGKALKDMSEAEMTALYKSDPVKFDKLTAEAKQNK